jgi:hypothetical protein
MRAGLLREGSPVRTMPKPPLPATRICRIIAMLKRRDDQDLKGEGREKCVNEIGILLIFLAAFDR